MRYHIVAGEGIWMLNIPGIHRLRANDTLSDNQSGHAVEDRERREELTEEKQTEAGKEEPMPVNTDPERAPQEGRKRVAARDEEEVAEAEEEGKRPTPARSGGYAAGIAC